MSFGNLWSRTKVWVAHLFRHVPAPGRFESGSKFSLHGLVGTAPLVWPSRDYLVYVPKGRSAWRRAPLLVLCHGCRQTPEEIAQGTRITELADRLGFIVLLPRQKDSANPWRCWNWFDKRTMNGKGEAAIVAAQIRSVRRSYRVDRKRILVAGMSAGGALAAVLGVHFPGLVAAVAVHSGLACGAASSALKALAVMSIILRSRRARRRRRGRCACRCWLCTAAPTMSWRAATRSRWSANTCRSTITRR
jgi:poly(hydroxyalkanoate) depolymerase family esterase